MRSLSSIERLQCHPGKSGGHVFGVSRSVTECFQSVTDYLLPVTELRIPKNMAVALPGMTLQPLYILTLILHPEIKQLLNCVGSKFRPFDFV